MKLNNFIRVREFTSDNYSEPNDLADWDLSELKDEENLDDTDRLINMDFVIEMYAGNHPDTDRVLYTVIVMNDMDDIAVAGDLLSQLKGVNDE